MDDWYPHFRKPMLGICCGCQHESNVWLGVIINFIYFNGRVEWSTTRGNPEKLKANGQGYIPKRIPKSKIRHTAFHFPTSWVSSRISSWRAKHLVKTIPWLLLWKPWICCHKIGLYSWLIISYPGYPLHIPTMILLFTTHFELSQTYPIDIPFDHLIESNLTHWCGWIA